MSNERVYCEQVTPRVRALKIETVGQDLPVLHEREIRKRRGPFSRLGPGAAQCADAGDGESTA